MDEEEQSQNPADEEGEDEDLSAQDPVEGGGRNHVSVLEALFALLLCLGLDFIDAVFDFTGAGILLAPIKVFFWFFFNLLFALKGGRYSSLLKRMAVWTLANGLEIVPILAMLPIRTVVMAWVIWGWNHEVDIKLEERIDKMTGFEKKAAEAVEKYLSRFE